MIIKLSKFVEVICPQIQNYFHLLLFILQKAYKIHKPVNLKIDWTESLKNEMDKIDEIYLKNIKTLDISDSDFQYR